MGLFEIFALFAIIGYLLYRYSVANHHVLAERGVPHEKPLPFLGNNLPMFTKKLTIIKQTLNQYQRTKQHKVYGYYSFRDPIFFLNDPHAIREICVKESSSFINHQGMVRAKSDRIFISMLTSMRDQRWRDMRNTLTPIFTGAKMRAMFPLMLDCFDEALCDLRRKVHGSGSIDIELKDTFSKLSNDLIATTAFGLKVNSFKDEKNDFYTLGTDLSKMQSKRLLAFFAYTLFPRVAQLLKLRLMPPKETDYFKKLVIDAMKYREEYNINRPDMIQLLMEAERESAQHWSKDEIVAQCFIFFFAAFQNNANFLCAACQMLMENPDVQDRLLEEILDMEQKLNGKKVDYDALQEMEYMNIVVDETLRIWPLGVLLDRECNNNFTLRDEDGHILCELKKGDRILIPVIGLHRDPEFFEEPEVFKPERFSKENKSNIKPYTYLPFGTGPRNCIGSRYALMQGKGMLYYLLREFRIERCEKSVKDLLNETRFLDFGPKDGFWFKITARNQRNLE